MTFESLGLSPPILKVLTQGGYTEPTAIQAQAIPEVIAGHDLIASAQTGTGKTAAFILPALEGLSSPAKSRSRGPRVLVLTPTRELATQVANSAQRYGAYLQVKVGSLVGGVPYPAQNKILSQPIDILVATPGRLLDHLARGRIDFLRLEMLILDEADRMLDMGFIEAVEQIAAATPKSRQTLLFSATFDRATAHLAQRLLKEPKRIQTVPQKTQHEHIEQRLLYVDNRAHKNQLLHHLLTNNALKQVLIFTATKRNADQLAKALCAQGHKAAALHGDMNQNARNRTLTQLRRGVLRVLVATDVAARGLSVNSISHVINYDLPRSAEDYVHRIGRTGRAGASGIALSFAAHEEQGALKRIERYTGQRLPVHLIPGLEPCLGLPKKSAKLAPQPHSHPKGQSASQQHRASGRQGGIRVHSPNDRRNLAKQNKP